MASFGLSLLSQAAKNNASALSQSLAFDKKTINQLSCFLKDNAKTHWKPVAGAFVLGSCVYGAIKIRSEILLAREELKVAPTLTEVRNLTHTANSVDGNCGPERNDFEDLDSLVDDFLLELEDQPELEDCLENDPTASVDVRWTSEEKEHDILDLQMKQRKFEIKTSDGLDEVSIVDPVLSGLMLKKVIVTQESYHKEQYRKQRKRVRSGQLSSATRGLAAKIRASFPIPDGSMLQQKAMCLYAAKECRKMCIREAQIATMVPKAVSLASVPTTSQVDLRQITKIDSVELRYKKMAWSGYKNKQGWAAHLASLFA
jgi:hypothetical protein